MDWTVICVPLGSNVDDAVKNTSGLGVVLTNGSINHQVAAVSFIRENSRHPKVSFTDQLTAEIAKADAAALALNELDEEAERLRALSESASVATLRELLGPPSRSVKGE
jgi:aromatic ring-opening dioxygenase catalytic subunit (LigB family)